MLHSHHSPGTRLANPEAPAVKREAEEDWRAMRVIHSAQFELSVRCSSFLSQPEGHRSAERAQLLKSSVVKVKDLHTGEEIVIAFKSGQQ
jgi:hypothetical protein